MSAGPVLKCNIHGAGSEVAAADTDLDDRRELLARRVRNLARMYFGGKCGDLVLLLLVKSAFIDAVSHDVLSELSSAEMVQDKALFARIDHSTFIKLLKLLRKFRLFREFRKLSEYRIVHSSGSKIKCQAGSHRNTVFLYTLRAACARHHFLQINTRSVLKRLV